MSLILFLISFKFNNSGKNQSDIIIALGLSDL